MNRYVFFLQEKKFHFAFFLLFLSSYLLIPVEPVNRLVTVNYDNVEPDKLENLSQQAVFNDETLTSGLMHTHSQRSGIVAGLHDSIGSGICVFDYNDDGWLDILVLKGKGNTHYYGKPEWWENSKVSTVFYRNQGGGVFIDATEETGFKSSSNGIACAIGDLDADGDNDVFIASHGQNEIWENIKGRQFKRKKFEINKSIRGWSTNASIADFNNDGKLDIYVSNYIDFESNSTKFEASAGYINEVDSNFNSRLHAGQANQLLINKGAFQFEDKAKILNAHNSQGRSFSATATDFNKDGWVDIMLANDKPSENKLFINDGGKGFKDQSHQANFATLDETHVISLINPEYKEEHKYFLSMAGDNYNKLYTKKDKLGFELVDRSEKFSLNEVGSVNDISWGPAIADFNLDGYEDLFVTNGMLSPNDSSKKLSQSQNDYLLISQNGVFQKQELFFRGNVKEISGSSRCAVSGDFNNDGSPDVLISKNNGLPQLLINQVEAKNWIGFNISFIDGKQVPIDTEVVLHTNLRKIFYKVNSGSNGFCWQEKGRFSIILKAAEVVDKVYFKIGKKEYSFNKPIAQKYNRLSAYGGFTQEQESKHIVSNIKANQVHSKLQVIQFLIKNNEFAQARVELSLLSNNDFEKNDNQFFLTLSRSLPLTEKLKLVPILMRSNVISIRKIGVEIIRETEDERLSRWLFGAISSQNSFLACHSAKVLEYFFSQEEAMVINKYAGLDILIEQVNSQSIDIAGCAIEALGESESYRSIDALLNVIKKNDSVSLRLKSIKALGRIRDKRAFPTLLYQLSDADETPKNKLEILVALKKIDSKFSISELLSNQLRTSSQFSILQVIELLIASDLPILQSEVGSVMADVISWRKEANDFDNEVRAQYLRIVENNDLISSDLVELSKSSQVKHRLLASMLGEGVYDEKAIFNNSSFLESLSGSSLLNKYVSNTFSQPKQSSELVYKAYPYVGIFIQKEMIARYGFTKNVSFNKVLLERIMSSFSLKEAEELCAPVVNELLMNKRSANAFFDGFSRWDKFHFIKSCINKVKSETLVKEMLKSENQRIRAAAISFFSSGTKKWQRDLTELYLESKNIKLDEKRLVINGLSKKMPPSQRELINSLFDENSDLLISLATAEKLAESRVWLQKNIDTLISRANEADDKNEHDLVIGFANIIYSVRPKVALKLLMKST